MNRPGYGYDATSLECTNMHNASNLVFKDNTVDNFWDYQYQWLLCNEPVDFFQGGAPVGTPTIVRIFEK